MPRSDDEVRRLREDFEHRHCALLEQVIDGELLDDVVSDVDEGAFDTYRHGGIAVEEKMRARGAASALVLLANDARVFSEITAITGCGRIGCFDGRVYRIASGGDHHDSWHDDMLDHRLVAMSINLTARPYGGGVLQIRDRESDRIVHEAKNAGLGDALLFRLAPELQHRVTPVEGSVARTAFAGWFKSEPTLGQVLLRGR